MRLEREAGVREDEVAGGRATNRISLKLNGWPLTTVTFRPGGFKETYCVDFPVSHLVFGEREPGTLD